MQFMNVELRLIDPDLDQPRKEFDTPEDISLAATLKAQGQLVPILVYRKGDRYVLLDGERRYRAGAKIGLKEMYACVMDGPAKPGDRLSAQLVISCHRKDFNPLEKAKAFAALKAEKSLNNKQLAEMLNISPGLVSQVLSILSHDAQVQDRIAIGELSLTSAYAVSQEKDPTKRRQLADQATSNGLTRSAIRAAAKNKSTSTVVCRLAGGKVTVTCERALDATGLVDLLTQTASAVRKAAKQGLDLPTIERVLADQAKLKPSGATT